MSERVQPRAKLLKPVLAALALHLILFALLFVSYSSTPELPPARPIVTAKLYQLESQNQATNKTNQKIAGDAEKTAARQHEREQLEQKKREQEAAKRKAEQQRKAKEKAAAEKKRQEEQKRAAEKKQQEQKKAEEAKRLAAQKAKQEAERKKAEEERKARERAAAEKKKRDAELAAKKAAEKAQEAARKAQEEKEAAALAELLANETKYQRELADKQGEQDIARIDDLIIQLVSEHWIRPAGAQNGMQVIVSVEFNNSGHITKVAITKSSGNQAFDNSAVAAIRSVGRVREIQDLPAKAKEQYRQKLMAFRPEDLGL